MIKTKIEAGEKPGLIDTKSIVINTYMPSNSHIHTIYSNDAEEVEKLVDDRNKSYGFIISLMMKKLGYDKIKKNDLVYFSAESPNSPKYIGSFKGFGVVDWTSSGAPIFELNTVNSWCIGSTEYTRNGDLPHFIDSKFYRFIPKLDWYDNDVVITPDDYVRPVTSQEKEQYVEAFNKRYGLHS